MPQLLLLSLARVIVPGLVLALATPVMTLAQTLKVPVSASLLTGGEAADPSAAMRPCLMVELEGAARPVRLPVAMDTTLLNKGDKPRATDKDIQVRDNRWHQGLIQFDLSALPRNARVRAARMEFTLGWIERNKAPARLQIHRVLTAWTHEATWFKPSPSATTTWNGLGVGRDYEAEPLATYATEEATGGTRVVLDGFGPVVADWLSGKRPNHGVVVQLFGRATQFNIMSNEAVGKKAELRHLRVEAGAETPLRLTLDLDLVRRLVLSVDEVREAELKLVLAGRDDPAGVKVEAGPGLVARFEGRELVVSGFGATVRERLSAGATTIEIPVRLSSSKTLVFVGPDGGRDQRPVFQVETVDHPNVQLWTERVVPRPGVYPTFRDGNLYYGGERLRLWGSLGYGDIPRMKRMGFNAWRIWPVAYKAYDENSIRTGDFAPVVKGDRSELDNIDRMYGEFKDNGFFLMATQLMGVMPGKLLTRDDSFVAGGADWEEWKAAVKALPGGEDAAGAASFRRMCFVDERVRKARFRHALNFLNRVNPYTGKRYAEEEHIAIWELDNELGFARHVLEGGALKWPAYFKNKLDARWTEWTRRRYPSEAALLKAWGKLDAGETYVALKAGPAAPQAVGASPERASDFVRFVVELTDSFYQELRDVARRTAPNGVGVASAAFSFDTQYRPNVPWLYQQSLSDVSNFGMYFWDTTSLLARPPAAYVMDSSTVENKVTVIYETNHARPSPYRAEFPFRLAAMAAWQDWDAVFFHYWGGQRRATDEEFMTWPMKYMTTGHYWDGVHHDQDPVMTSTMAIAGRIFVEGMIAPAPKPALYRVGGKGIFSYRFANGLSTREDFFSRGARLRFEPNGDFDLIKENSGGDATPTGAVQSGDAITWDWPNGRLLIDTPKAKAYVGPAPEDGWNFKDGITFSGVSAPWVSFALVSADGRPLAEASRAWFTGVFDAANTGFAFDWSVRGGPVDQAKAISNHGRAPIRVEKVDYTVSFPRSMDWAVKSYDFALREIVDAKGSGSVVRLRSQPGKDPVIANVRAQEAWMNVIDIQRRGDAAQPVVDASPGAARSVKGGEAASVETTDAALAGVWHPLSGLSWGDNYPLAHRKIRELPMRNTGVSRFDPKAGDDVAIEISDAYAVLDAPARIEVMFAKGVMNGVVVTFSQPPALRDAVADYEKRLGKPAEKSLTDDQFSQSTVRWVVPGKAADLLVQMTDAQGVMKVVYSLRKK